MGAAALTQLLKMDGVDRCSGAQNAVFEGNIVKSGKISGIDSAVLNLLTCIGCLLVATAIKTGKRRG